MKKAIKGQSLSEYILLATLVAVVSIGGLSFLANTTSDKLPEVIDCIFEGGCAGSGGMTTVETLGSAGQITNLPIPAPNTSHVSFSLSNGSQITLTNYPTDLPGMIETAGGNGTTKLLLASFEELITALIDAGEIDATQAGTLNDLANQGHIIANLQEGLENFDANNPGWKVTNYLYENLPLNNTSSVYSPASANVGIGFSTAKESVFSTSDIYESVSLEDFISQASYDSSSNKWGVNSAGTRIEAGAEMSSFITLYKNAESSGALNDPAVSAIIANLTENLAGLSSDLAQSVGEKARVNLASSATTDPIIDADLTSNLQSQDICAAGGGTSSGISCNN